MDQTTLIRLLQRGCPSTYPAIWSAIYTHRKTCLRLVLALVDELVEDECITRAALREELADAIREIEKRRP